jgi:hypothetical protein
VLLELAYRLVLVPACNLDVRALTAAVVDHILPNPRLLQGLRVANDHQEVLGPGDGHIESSLVQQEAKTLLHEALEVASYTVEDDDVLLATLEGINSVDIDCVMDQALLV